MSGNTVGRNFSIIINVLLWMTGIYSSAAVSLQSVAVITFLTMMYCSVSDTGTLGTIKSKCSHHE